MQAIKYIQYQIITWVEISTIQLLGHKSFISLDRIAHRAVTKAMSMVDPLLVKKVGLSLSDFSTKVNGTTVLIKFKGEPLVDALLKHHTAFCQAEVDEPNHWQNQLSEAGCGAYASSKDLLLADFWDSIITF